MVAQRVEKMSVEEYLAFDRASSDRHMFANGQIYLQAGGSDVHSLIIGNVFAGLHSQLRKRPCRVYQSDMRVRVEQTQLHTYPDVTVVCDEPRFVDGRRDILLNPIVIIEVLSPSTELYDRSMKFQNYRLIETLIEYVLISQRDQRAERFTRREGNQWLLDEVVGADGVLLLGSIGCELPLAEIYEKVEFLSGDDISLGT